MFNYVLIQEYGTINKRVGYFDYFKLKVQRIKILVKEINSKVTNILSFELKNTV